MSDLDLFHRSGYDVTETRFRVRRRYNKRLCIMRTRHQEGHVEERGTVRKRWYGIYYVYVRNEAGREVRRHVGVTLGKKGNGENGTLRKYEAEAKLRRFITAAAAIQEQLRRLIAERSLDPAQQAVLQEKVESIVDSESDPEIGASRALAFLGTWVQPTGDHLTLEWFTRERFLPMKEKVWAPSTRETNLGNINLHLLPALGAVPLAKLDKFKCQTFLNNLRLKTQRSRAKRPRTGDVAKNGFSFTVIDHNRTMLKAILEEAVEADLIGKNPARKLENPETEESEKFVLPKDQARALLDALPFRDRLMAMIAAFCALRPGEIFGLRWSSWRGDHLMVEGTAWRGVYRPGKAKTKGSKASIALPDVLIPVLKMWREHCGNPPAEALIFPSKQKKKLKNPDTQQRPMRPENWLRRRVKPIAVRLKITVPVNFQVLRRTFATNAQGYGNPKDVQAHLRHTDIATTMDVYTQMVPESVRKLVNAVTHDVMTAEPAAIVELTPLTRRVQ